jgi:tRNA dimethylallyltransferase
MSYFMNHESTDKTLIVIAGPTASGKTALAIQLAQNYKAVIISADSRQFYREMAIGTAKPTDEELITVKHYFINSHSITENFTVGDFEKQCLGLLKELFKYHDKVIMVGGSGLYIKAVCEGFDQLPVANHEIRSKLNGELQAQGIERLQEKLKIADPVYYETVDLNNPQRIIRALEVFEATGKPFSSFHTSLKVARPFRTIKFGLDWPREILYQRINQRVDTMLQQGLIEEVKSLLPYRHFNALNTVGYNELFDYFDGKTELHSAISLIKQNTRRFAKRQLTWFKKDKDIIWMSQKQNLTGLLALIN